MLSERVTTRDIFMMRVFEEPLVPIGADPPAAENAALAAALRNYSARSGPDDFSSLTAFLERYPESAWKAALLTNLGLEYYRSGHYSKTLEAWGQAWDIGKAVTDPQGRALMDRAAGELANMHARLGHMVELGALLESVEGRAFSGPATERIVGAREGLWNMENRPGTAFRCGPFALHQIKCAVDPKNTGSELIRECESTQRGFSLEQVRRLSESLGLDFQSAYRTRDAVVVVPSVMHSRLDHYAAIVRQEGERYLLQDPTFGRDVWITRAALESETSGYFLVPSGQLAPGWRAVPSAEGESVWGRGLTDINDPDPHGPCDAQTPGGDACGGDDECRGMAVPRVHLMLVSLNIRDQPVGYAPPVGPEVRFTVRYNQREANQPASFNYSNLGPKWTFDWLTYIKDNPSSPLEDPQHYMMGGGTRIFTGFGLPPAPPTYAFQQLDQTRLTRTSSNAYEMLARDGTRMAFSASDSESATSRKLFLTRLTDASGAAVTLSYDAAHRLVAITDAILQVTTLSYDHPTDEFKITKVTDPFGRFATFEYDAFGRLVKIIDVIGLTSAFTYDVDGKDDSKSDFIVTLTTPYGVTTFAKSEGGGPNGTTRSLETIYPDGDRDRVEYNQFSGIALSDPPERIPAGMATRNEFLSFRNTFYWDKMAYASSYPDFNKARIYHWLHGRAHVPSMNSTSGILESVKEPLEGRVWFDYAGQLNGSVVVGSTSRPNHVGRVLDDGSTQLYRYEYNGFGNVTRQVDPVGRTFSYTYDEDDANGVDLLEVRQIRADQSELLSRTTYDAGHRHLPAKVMDAAGQTTTYTYNPRGQLQTRTNARGETIVHIYDANGYLTATEGPLPGSSIVFTYDGFGRVRTRTDESGYTLTFDYDALDRLTTITFPDGTSHQFTYTHLDLTLLRDRVGRQTSVDFNNVRQMIRRTDPLGRVMLFQWCKCGALKSLTDPLGRTTGWQHDIRGRVKSKEYADGAKVSYRYEDTISRLRLRIDEKLQVTQFDYNRDDTLSRISYTNCSVPTANVAFAYDEDYRRLRSMTDGTGSTHYRYVPVNAARPLGAGRLMSVDGPLAGDTITFDYDELGRRIAIAINGVGSSVTYDAAGRPTTNANALGVFDHGYDGSSFRQSFQSHPNGHRIEFGYSGNVLDQNLQRITNRFGPVPISEFVYGRQAHTEQITSWSQQGGGDSPEVHSFAYDAVDQLSAASVSAGAIVVGDFEYAYDLAGNRVSERIGATTQECSYNAVNALTSGPGGAATVSYEWDAEHRLTSVISGNQKAELTYDGLGRCVAIRLTVNGAEVSNRRFVWCEEDLCEERTGAGVVSKRFFSQGVRLETSAAQGEYYYTRDHLGSIRELVDKAGTVRARYSYDPFGRRVRIAGDLETDFGFAGMLWLPEASLNLALFRAYDPVLGRWLSRDPLDDAEWDQGPNLYAYVLNNPVNLVDPSGLAECCRDEIAAFVEASQELEDCYVRAFSAGLTKKAAKSFCRDFTRDFNATLDAALKCQKTCKPPKPPPTPKPPKPAKPAKPTEPAKPPEPANPDSGYCPLPPPPPPPIVNN